MRRLFVIRTVVVCLLVPGAGCATPDAGPAPATGRTVAPPGVSTRETRVKPGINDKFRNQPDPAKWRKRFEVESREVYHERERILDAVGAEPGTVLADIGAGTGLFTVMFAKQVGPTGKVLAVDIAPTFLASIEKRARADGLKNVETVLGTDDSAELPPASIDVAFVCATYHHFEHPMRMLRSIHRALRPGGRLVVVDFDRIEGKSRAWILEHVRAGKRQVTTEIVAAGFARIDEVKIPGFKEDYLLRFRRN